MTKAYEVTAENSVDHIQVVVFANNKEEALVKGRKRIQTAEHLSRYDGRIKWTVREAGE